MITQQTAAALVMYLQRAHQIVPTTGLEFTTMHPLLAALEQAAQGQSTISVTPNTPPTPPPA